jgi:hypothetical protein
MTDAELIELVLAEARTGGAVRAACEAYDEHPNQRILDSDIPALHEAWMHARAACRAAVLERLEAAS